MLLKCCTQHFSIFGKPTSGHRTGKCQSSSQFPRRAVLKNVQITGQLHLFPMRVRVCSKSCKLGFSIIWTENFQMFKLGLEKAKEPEIKLPTFSGSQRKQGNSRRTFTSVSLTTLKSWTVWIITNWGKFFRRWAYQTNITRLLRNRYAVQKATVRSRQGIINWFKISEGVCQGWILSPCWFNLYTENVMRNAELDVS